MFCVSLGDVDVLGCGLSYVFVFFKQKTAYEMRISDWSSDVCSSDLRRLRYQPVGQVEAEDRDQTGAIEAEAQVAATIDHIQQHQMSEPRPQVGQVEIGSRRRRIDRESVV